MSENDVRIYVSKKEMNKNASEFAGNFDAVMRQRANGSIDKARRLGASLATIAPTGDGDGIFVNLKDHLSPKFFVQDILYQIRVLLVFACETLLQMELPTELLSTTAIASMYNAMENDMPGFYSNIANGAAFTFYYLAIQKDGDMSENIGEAFDVAAMRELEEETGYRCERVTHLFDLYTTVAFSNEKIGIYLADNLIPSKQNLDEDEYLSVEIYSLNELQHMITDGRIHDAKTIAALMYYKTIKEK